MTVPDDGVSSWVGIQGDVNPIPISRHQNQQFCWALLSADPVVCTGV